MHTEAWDPALQAERRRELFATHRAWARDIFTDDGAYILDSRRWKPLKPDERNGNDPRVLAWHAFAFFAGDDDDAHLANAILRRAGFSPRYDFQVCALLQLALRHRDRMAPDILERLETCFKVCGPEQLAASSFVGMNDNFPVMSTLIMILAGEWSRRPELAEVGLERLREFVERLDHDGAISEYNSPTYTALTLAGMADLARFAANADVRRLALRIEQQVWYDVCARFHTGTSQMGGPSSRSYTADSCGQMHNMRYALHVAFGEQIVFISPLRHAFTEDARIIQHHDDPMFSAANGMWVAASEFHVPDECGRMMTERPEKFEVNAVASCAFLWQPDDWRVTAAGRGRDRFRRFLVHRYAPFLLTTCHAPDYSLGTASNSLSCQGGDQRDAFFVTYRRRRPAAGETLGLEDTRTVYCRYVFNDAEPVETKDLLRDMGHKTCVQKGNVAVVAYRPGIDLLQGITSMRLLVVLPEIFGRVDAVYLGESRVKGDEGRSPDPVPVFVSDGMIFLAFRPLALTDYGRQTAVRVRRVGRFLTIAFYNYAGPARSLNFPLQAPLFTQNGFGFEIAAGDECGFEDFRRRVVAASLEDDFVERGIRRIRYAREGVDLRIDCDPLDDGAIPAAWIDGRLRETPRYRSTGIAGLPWP